MQILSFSLLKMLKYEKWSYNFRRVLCICILHDSCANFLGKFASSFCTYLTCHFTHTTKRNNEENIISFPFWRSLMFSSKLRKGFISLGMTLASCNDNRGILFNFELDCQVSLRLQVFDHSNICRL